LLRAFRLETRRGNTGLRNEPKGRKALRGRGVATWELQLQEEEEGEEEGEVEDEEEEEDEEEKEESG
jgi:hypothetical protein